MSFELMKAETAKQVSTSKEFMDAVVEVSGLKHFVPTVRVVDAESKVLCAETMARVKKARKQLEAMRQTAKGPYLEMGKTVDRLFKPFLDDCAKMVEQLDGQYVPYVSKEIAEAEKMQKEAMARAIEARNVEDTEVKAEMMQPSTKVDTDSGQTSVRKTVQFEVVDVLKLIKAAADGRNKLPLDVVGEREPRLRELVNSKKFSKAQWRKWGVKVEEKLGTATRT